MVIEIEELKQRFPDIRDIKPYGWCVVVPGSQFDPDWEFQLEDQGYKVFMVDLDRKPVALVSCVKKNAEGERVSLKGTPTREERQKGNGVSTPESSPKGVHGLKPGNKIVPWTESDLARLMQEWPRARGDVEEKAEALTKLFPGRTATAIKLRYLKQLKTQRNDPRSEKRGTGLLWSEGETQKLVSLWNQGMRKSEIAKAFPGRSEKSVIMAITRLKLKGTIQKRKSGRQASSLPKVEKPSKNSDEQEKTPLRAVSNGKPSTENLVCFESYCRKCRQRRTVEDSAVWKICPICEEPLIIWNVEEKAVET